MNTIQKSLTTLFVGAFFWSSMAAASDSAADNAEGEAAAQRSSVKMASEAASEAAQQAIDSVARESEDDLDVRLTDLKLVVRRVAPVTIAAN